MKKLVNVQEVEGEGLEALMGERVTLFCINYFYTGKLIGVNTDFVLLTDCGIIYETGPFTDKDWTDYQKLPHDIYVRIPMIESFGIVK